jgi:hypothetical protein
MSKQPVSRLRSVVSKASIISLRGPQAPLSNLHRIFHSVVEMRMEGHWRIRNLPGRYLSPAAKYF